MIAIIIFIAIGRVIISASIVMGRVIGALLFAPIFGGRGNDQIKIKIVRDYSSVIQRASGMARVINTPVPGGGGRVVREETEASQNQRDTALALKSLGFPKHKAEQVAALVAQELGRDAPLNKMVNVALKSLDRAH